MSDHKLKTVERQWHTSAKKEQARRFMLERYCFEFKRKSIPSNRSYVSLCGRMTDESGEFFSGSELDQVLKMGIIKNMSQFYGIEREWDTHNLNSKISGSNWHHGDFLSIIGSLLRTEEGFSPSIVNFDSIQKPDTDNLYVPQLINLLHRTRLNKIMLVVNYVMKSFIDLVPDDSESTVRNLCSYPQFRRVWKTGEWTCHNEMYSYDGTSENSQSKMATILFFKK